MRYLRNGRILLLLSAMVIIFSPLSTIARRLSDYNTTGWIAGFGSITLASRTSLWLEYQMRREGLVTNWQQSLARAGLQHHFPNGISVMAGYAYITTYPYGTYPAGPYPVPEQRIFQQLMWNDKISRINLNHRIRLEQRFGGKLDQQAPNPEITDWIYTNRARYQLRTSVPLNKHLQGDNTWYAAAFNELFIGFGKNVQQNVFDQNRISMLLGYQFNRSFRLEGGYLNQTVQQGALVNQHEVFQYNNGVLINAYFTY